MSRDLDAEADAFVIGLLDADETARLDAALVSDPAWAAAVGRARDRFLPLDLTAERRVLPADLLQRIQGKLSAPERPANLSFAPNLRRFAPAGLAAMLALACGLFIGSRTLGPEPQVIAVLMDEAGTARAIVEDFGAENARIRFVSDVTVPEGQQMQVWTLPSMEMGPVSLGLLRTDGTERLVPPELPAPAQGQLYEITLEPEGGSPTGRPTGPILAKGLAARQGDV